DRNGNIYIADWGNNRVILNMPVSIPTAPTATGTVTPTPTITMTPTVTSTPTTTATPLDAATPAAWSFTVNTTSDSLSSNACATNLSGQCSLREALVEANSAAAGSAISVSLPAASYPLSQGQLIVTLKSG